MVFDERDMEVEPFTRRYQTYDSAEAGHQDTVNEIESTMRDARL
jgi:hypothetical protein